MSGTDNLWSGGSPEESLLESGCLPPGSGMVARVPTRVRDACMGVIGSTDNGTSHRGGRFETGLKEGATCETLWFQHMPWTFIIITLLWSLWEEDMTMVSTFVQKNIFLQLWVQEHLSIFTCNQHVYLCTYLQQNKNILESCYRWI